MSWTNVNKSTSTWISQIRGGQGWKYDQANLTYDSLTENISNDPLLYDTVGYFPVWTMSGKSSTSWNTQVRGGQGWKYDQTNINYDSTTDPLSLDSVLYDSIGYPVTWSNVNKSVSSWATTNKS